jgi:nicotinate-nucleotide pyrophosphorylase (carboxylating)
MRVPEEFLPDLRRAVATALKEDIGSGDITAELIAPEQTATAHVISREQAIICGQQWVDEVFRQLDPGVHIEWHCNDGEMVTAGQDLLSARGSARSLLTGERTALNFLQLLSATASSARLYADLVADTPVKLLDTRKTIPGLRTAQKYAVRCGGCYNHRIGLYDAFLIKENHIAACGSIAAAIAQARANHGDKPVELEVENLAEFDQALAAGADIIMLDNFSHSHLHTAVDRNEGRAKLEASGGITRQTIRSIANTGVDYISIGALTKDATAIDLSMRFEGDSR